MNCNYYCKNCWRWIFSYSCSDSNTQFWNYIVGTDYGTWGNIKVKYNLWSNHECRLLTKDTDGENGYVEGAGTLVIPDHVIWNNEKYYVKRIPSNWSDGQNDINGIEFASNISRLEEICDNAFDGTNALDIYKGGVCTFPTPLARIGTQAFYNTDLDNVATVKGFVFPSSLVWIGERAFANSSRIGSSTTNKGFLEFKGVFDPNNFGEKAFSPFLYKNYTEYIYAPTFEIATNICNYIASNFASDFETGPGYLIANVR